MDRVGQGFRVVVDLTRYSSGAVLSRAVFLDGRITLRCIPRGQCYPRPYYSGAVQPHAVFFEHSHHLPTRQTPLKLTS